MNRYTGDSEPSLFVFAKTLFSVKAASNENGIIISVLTLIIETPKLLTILVKKWNKFI